MAWLVALPTADDTFKVSIADSKVNWKAYKVGGQHEGYVDIRSGFFTTDGDKLTGGSFVLDMRTITCTDLQGNMKEKLETHLKSPDFFSSNEYNTASFVITEAKPEGDKYTIVGTMVIKNIAHEISFPADIEIKGNKIIAGARLKIDRTKYNVRYGSKRFFDNLKDKFIHDEFDLYLNFVAMK